MGTYDTKQRLLDAAVHTLVHDGIAGASARTIGNRAEVNPALIYYHFGNLDGLLVAAATQVSQQRAEVYRQRLEHVTSLGELAALARDLHHEDREQGNLAMLTQLFAGTRTHPALAPALNDNFRIFQQEVARTIERLTAGTAVEEVIPTSQLAWLISAGFVGIELLDTVTHEDEAALFDSLETVSELVDQLLEAGAITSAIVRRRIRRNPRSQRR